MTKIVNYPLPQSSLAPMAAVLEHPLVIRAREAAEQGFEGKFRKVPSGSGLKHDPYFCHTEGVAILLADAGFGPEVVAAGYLHDHPEDLSNVWPIERIRQEFGDKVADLVWAVTQRDKSLSWEDRNKNYLVQLEGSSIEALAVSCADKTFNIRSANELLKAGYPVSSFLKRGWQVNSGKFHELKNLYIGKVPDQLISAFIESLRIFDEFGSMLEKPKA